MSPEAPTVLVIGDAMLDVSALPAGPVRDGQDVPAEIRVRPGGQGANVAVRLARRDVAVRLVCGIGDDAAGRILADALRDESVDVDPVRVPATGIVVITLGPSGERTMLSQRQPLGVMLADRDIPEAAWAVLSGYVLLEAGNIRTAQRFAALRSIRVLAGCAVPESARASWRAAAIEARPDLLIVNRDEAAWLDPAQDLAPMLVVTAADAVSATVGGGAVRITPRARPDAIDTTGAGDAFVATLVARLADAAWPPSPASLETAMMIAAEHAGEVATVSGAQSHVPAQAGGPGR